MMEGVKIKAKRLFGKTFIIKKHLNGSTLTLLENLSINQVAQVFNTMRTANYSRPVERLKEPERGCNGELCRFKDKTAEGV